MAQGSYQGWMAFGDPLCQYVEVINQARTAAYLQNGELAPDGFQICDVLDFGGCEGYTWMPDEDGIPVQMGFATDPAPTPDDEADPAPWYSDAYPESADALGFYVEEWTGLDDSHITRPATGVIPFGSQFGNKGSEGRTMLVTVLAIARTDRAMVYLFNWLSTRLTNICSTCATETLAFRQFCDDDDPNPLAGIAELHNVSLVRGLQWEGDPIDRGPGKCVLRRMSFTLMAGDPCKYLPASEVPVGPYTTQSDDLAQCVADRAAANLVRPDLAYCRPICSQLADDCRQVISFSQDTVGSTGPVIQFHNDHTEWSWPFRAIVYDDPLGIGATPNPCGLRLLGEVYVRPLPPNSRFLWDVAHRDVFFADVGAGAWLSGWPWIDANDPPEQRFFTVGCSTTHLVLEPGSFCATEDAGDYVYEGLDITDPHYPTVESVHLVERFGCF